MRTAKLLARAGVASVLLISGPALAQTQVEAPAQSNNRQSAPTRPPLAAAQTPAPAAMPDVSTTLLSPISVQALALPDQTPATAIQPVSVLRGTALIRQRSESLGDTLAKTPGISAADFGAGVGRPVIRGLSGARVRVQENGLSSADVSTVSQDHAVTIDPYSATQIEVLKGPATLLYGSGAIGGVVNVVTDRIPTSVPKNHITGNADLERGDSTQGERLENLDITGGDGPIAVNIQGLKRLTDDYQANNSRKIDNSATDTDSYSGGTSYIGDWGFVGAAASHFGRTYGVPGETSHISITENRYDLRGEVDDLPPALSKLEFSAAYTDYRHTEGEETPDEIFDNNETEFRIAATHVPVDKFTGVVGVQGSKRSYEAFGDVRTFVPPTITQSIALFWVEERPIGENWTIQGGARVEYNDENTSQGRPDTNGVPYSVSLGARRDIGESYVATVSAGHYERAPSTEELYSFGPHDATETYERGNPNFGNEQSNDFELGFRKIKGRVQFDTSLYYTNFHNYIYEASVDQGLNADGTGTRNSDGIADRVNGQGIFDPLGEFELINFSAANANFYGGEGLVSYDLIPGPHRLTVHVQGDYVRADLTNGENLPRITPGRYGAGLDYDSKRWTGNVLVLQTTASDHLAPREIGSDSYTDMSAFAGYKIPSFDKNTSALVYLRADNLLDQNIIRQTSFLRVSQPGRSVLAGLNVNF